MCVCPSIVLCIICNFAVANRFLSIGTVQCGSARLALQFLPATSTTKKGKDLEILRCCCRCQPVSLSLHSAVYMFGHNSFIQNQSNPLIYVCKGALNLLSFIQIYEFTKFIRERKYACVCESVFVLDVEPSAATATATASQKNMSESNAEWEMDAMKFISYIECWKEIEKEARSHIYKHTQQLLWNWNIIHFSVDNRARRWMSQRKQTTVFVCHRLFASIIHYARRIGLLYCFLFFSFR